LLRHVPRPATPLIGREREIAFARAVLAPESDLGAETNERNRTPRAALLTLTGPGGAGKTRLALHLAAEIGVALADGAVFVALDEISDPALVPAAIAAAVELGDESGRATPEQIVDNLRDRELLLVLDNFEQVTGAATLVADLLRFCPRLRIVVTSRERLQLRGEQELPLPPLDLPAVTRRTGESDGNEAGPPVDEIRRSAAVQLFVARAQSVNPAFEISVDNAAVIAEICRRLDGLPLAIELAAARVRSLSPRAILDRLDRRLDLLSRGLRDLPARQQTMRDTIAWSHDLLDAVEQRLFARVSVFAGGADLAAVEAVASGDLVDAAAIFDRLESLADKSLLRLVEVGHELRLDMLQTIREYGLERLRGCCEDAEMARRHAEYFLALAESCEPLLTGPGQTRCLDRLERERANLRAALGWFCARGAIEEALRLGGALWRFWWLRGDVGEGRTQLESLFATADGVRPEVLAKALNGAGVLADSRGDWETAAQFHERSLAIARRLGDLSGMAWSLNNLGVVAINQGDFPRARTLLEENLEIAERTGDRASIATALIDLGQVAFHESNYERARAHWRRSLSLFRDLGDESHLARCLNNLGFVAGQRGDLEGARALLTESLAHHRNVGDWQGIASTLNNLATIANDTGEVETAGRLYRESYALALEGGNQLYAAVALENLAAWTLRHGDRASAEARYQEALGMYRAVGDLQGLSTCLSRLTEFLAAAGRLRDAATLLGAVARYKEHHPDLVLPDLDETAQRLRRELGAGAFVTSWELGREIAIEDVIRIASGSGAATIATT
jgi:predicted ATPase